MTDQRSPETTLARVLRNISRKARMSSLDVPDIEAAADLLDEQQATIARLEQERDKLLAVLKDVELVINPRDIGGISMHEWGSRIRVAASKILEVIASVEGAVKPASKLKHLTSIPKVKRSPHDPEA